MRTHVPHEEGVRRARFEEIEPTGVARVRESDQQRFSVRLQITHLLEHAVRGLGQHLPTRALTRGDKSPIADDGVCREEDGNEQEEGLEQPDTPE